MKTTAKQSSILSVATHTRFWGFFWTQFLGALNDNLAKNALVALLAFESAQFGSMSANTVSNAAAGLFILPFFIASAFCGILADKFERRTIALWVKGLEVFIQFTVLAGFYFTNIWLLLGSILMLGFHSTLFGPIKGALIPTLTEPHQIVAANGLVSGATFAAILIGTLLGGLFGSFGIQGGMYVSYLGIALAVLGLFFASKIPHTGPGDPSIPVSFSFWRQTKEALNCAKEPLSVWRSVFGISWFWFFGLTILSQFPVYSKEVLGTNATGLTVLLGVFSVGVGVGSLLCNRLSGGRVEIGLVPLGSIGMSVFGFLFYHFTPNTPFGKLISGWELLSTSASWPLLGSLFGLAIFGGFFIVPLYALIQVRSNPLVRSRVIAANNILNSGFMVASALMALVALNFAGASIAQLILSVCIMNLVVAAYIYKTVPEFLLRFVAWFLTRLFYRMRITGVEQLPKEGAALLVCNHLSFVDALVLMGSLPRPARFVMDWRIYQTPGMHWLFKDAKTIPIATAKENPAMMKQAFDQVDQCLKEGELVLIFPEGRITSDGQIGPFKSGMSQILSRQPVPVYVLTLSGLWGSFFSRKHGAAMRKPFARGVWNRVSLTVSPTQNSSITPDEARAICQAQYLE